MSINPEILNDYNLGDWIGIKYNIGDKGVYTFPTIIEWIASNNSCLDIGLHPNNCPNTLETSLILDIWPLARDSKEANPNQHS